MTTTATFAQNIARLARDHRAADAEARRDVDTTNRIGEMYRLNAKLQALYTGSLDRQDTNSKIFKEVDGKTAPVAIIIARMDAEIKRRESASYEYQTEDGVYGSDHQPEIPY
jgi:predicted membrane-bound mannosyltransferase